MWLEVYKTGQKYRDLALTAFCEGTKTKLLDSGRTLLPGVLPVLWGFGGDHQDKLIKSLREGRPFFHLDHAYVKRGYPTGRFRVNFNKWHQTELLNVPSDRSELFLKRLQPWKKGSKILVILPSEKICEVISQVEGHITPKGWAEETELELRKFTTRKIMRKEKGPGLLGELKDTHAVVSLSSVAEVEAGLYGVPVFTSKHSPAFQISGSLQNIETPLYPDREKWIHSLAYSQFHIDEFSSGKAWEILKGLYLEHLDLRAA